MARFCCHLGVQSTGRMGRGSAHPIRTRSTAPSPRAANSATRSATAANSPDADHRSESKRL